MIAIRPIFVLGLSLLTAFLVILSSPLTALPVSPATADHGADVPARPASEYRLAQATGPEQRGPRPLGAVSGSVQVPSLQCLSVNDAEAALQERQLRLGQVHQRPSSACPNGGVVAQSPPRGTTVRTGAAVEVVVATGADAGVPEAPDAAAGVPNLEGLTPAEAQSLLRREGLEIGEIKRESAPAPLGTIISQSPSVGTPATVGTRINIIVAAEVRVPDLRRLGRNDAVEQLDESSLELGRITEESSSQPDGTVIKQWPLPGVPAAAGDKVDITVAKGQAVPDLLTLGLNEARSQLRAAGLEPGRVDSRASDRPRGTIIAQTPAPNTSVRPGISVNVVLAAPPIVPDLAGKTIDEAKRLLSPQLLAVGSITSKISSKPQGTVLEQQPKANAEAAAQSKVDLVLADGFEAPKLVGLTLDEAGAKLAEQLMRLGKIERQVAVDGDRKIVEQTPPPGGAATLGGEIDVVVRVPPTVPDLRGLDQNAVTARLAEQQLSISDIGYQLAPDVPSETVVLQDPPPGTKISNGQAVAIVMAVNGPPPDRPDLVAVPTLTNLTVTQADKNLQLAGLVLQLDGEPDDSRPHRVTAQAPEPGRFTQIGTPVIALIEPIDKVIVPDLTGLDQTSSDTMLSDTFLAVGERSWKLSAKPEGTVVGQEPLPGTEVAFGNPVDLELSASSLIPDLTGMTPEEAYPILAGQSLQLGGIEEVFSLRWPGTIVAQTPPSDTPTGGDSIVRVQVVGLVGPLTAGGSLLLALAGLVWFKTRQSGQGNPAPSTMPPPVYGIAKSSASRPAFNRTARAARPEAPVAPEPDYVVDVDQGNQVIQTDAPNLVKPSIRLRGRADPGEQKLAIEKS